MKKLTSLPAVLMLVLGLTGGHAYADDDILNPNPTVSCTLVDSFLPVLLDAQQKGATSKELRNLLDKETQEFIEALPKTDFFKTATGRSVDYTVSILDEISKQPKQRGQIKLERHIEQFTKKHYDLCVEKQTKMQKK
ncbi:MAG: hypothetical protein Q4B81_06260 [Moraxella sp.]|nr:hypothetical protein [Moraxella sp.]